YEPRRLPHPAALNRSDRLGRTPNTRNTGESSGWHAKFAKPVTSSDGSRAFSCPPGNPAAIKDTLGRPGGGMAPGRPKARIGLRKGPISWASFSPSFLLSFFYFFSFFSFSFFYLFFSFFYFFFYFTFFLCLYF